MRDRAGASVRPQEIAAYIFALLVFFAIFSTFSVEFFGQDSAQYLSTVDQLRVRGALATTTLFFDIQVALGMPAPQTVWPPLYPALAAAVAFLTGVDGVTAMGLVNAAAHALGVLLLYGLAKRFLVSEWVAIAWAAGAAAYWPAWSNAMGGATEPIFSLMLVAGFSQLAASCDAGEVDDRARRLRLILGAAFFFGCATATRYIGVAFVASLCLYLLIGGLRRGELRRGLLEAVAAGVAASVVIAPLIVRNLYLTGTLSGGPQVGEPGVLSDIALQTRYALGAALGASGSLGWLLIALLVVAGGLSVALAARSRLFAQRRGEAGDRNGLSDTRAMIAAVAAGGVVLTVAIVYALAFMTTAYLIEARYFVVLTPVLVIVGVALWPTDSARRGVPERAAQGAAIVALLGLLTWNAAVRLETLGGGAVPQMTTALQEPLDASARAELGLEGRTLAEALSAEASISSPLLSNQSQHLYTVLRVPTLGVPPERLTAIDWTADDVLDLARRFNVEWVIVFKDLIHGDGVSDDFVYQAVQSGTDAFGMVLETDEILLFRIDAGELDGE